MCEQSHARYTDMKKKYSPKWERQARKAVKIRFVSEQKNLGRCYQTRTCTCEAHQWCDETAKNHAREMLDSTTMHFTSVWDGGSISDNKISARDSGRNGVIAQHFVLVLRNKMAWKYDEKKCEW